jgi:uncharacterized membrane protein (DUF2068 family)
MNQQAAGRPEAQEDADMAQPLDPRARQDRFLPWIAAERGFRALVLLTVGIVLVTHPHARWAQDVTHLAEHLGLDPRDNGIRHIIERLRRITIHEDVVFGVAALAYGALEAAEGYGLWRRRRWGEWLTVLATSLLFVPEIWELTKSATALKLAALLVNVVVVVYLIRRLRRGASSRPRR